MAINKIVFSIAVSIGFFAFVYYTSWKGLLGFCIGVGTCFYIIERHKTMLDIIIDSVRHGTVKR